MSLDPRAQATTESHADQPAPPLAALVPDQFRTDIAAQVAANLAQIPQEPVARVENRTIPGPAAPKAHAANMVIGIKDVPT